MGSEPLIANNITYENRIKREWIECFRRNYYNKCYYCHTMTLILILVIILCDFILQMNNKL